MCCRVRPELLADEVVSKPPVLLIHGDQDEVVPPISMPEAGDALQEAGFDVFGHVMKGISFIGKQFNIDLG